MATALTRSDGLGIYHTGASARGGTQRNALACLGGKRAATPMTRLAALMRNPIPSLLIDHVAGANGTGDGLIRALSATTLAYIAPGGAIGPTVTINDGDTVLLESADDDKAIRVTRHGSTALAGEMTLNLMPAFNNALGMSNISSAARVAGRNDYASVMLRAHGAGSITNIAIWIGTLGTTRTTDAGQLGATGAGTITTTGSFADWPDAGWAHVRTAASATREIVYYTSRTATALTVPATGRARLGTSAAAGAADDTVASVPGLRIAIEAPDANGDIQVIASSTTAPTGVTWSTALSSIAGLTIATLASGANYGLWVHREIPAGATVDGVAESLIKLQYTADAVVFTESLPGYWRMADDALDRYEIFLGVDAEPDLTATPNGNSATLPISAALTPPGSGTREYRAVVRKRNRYNVTGLNRYSRLFAIDSTGATVRPALTAPADVSVTDLGGGQVTIQAKYFPDSDTMPADTWAIYWRADGVNPDPATDTPVTQAMATSGQFFATPGIKLHYRLAAQPKGADIRVIVRARRSLDSVESANVTASTVTVTSLTPGTPTRRQAHIGTAWSFGFAPATISETIYVDQSQNIRFEMTPGITEFWSGSTLIFRMRYDSAAPDSHGFWTIYGIDQTQQSGTASDTPVEVISATQFYVTVAGIRRMKIDTVTGKISFSALQQAATRAYSTHTAAAVAEFDFHTLFQVWDPATFDYQTVAALDIDGIFKISIPWRQRQTTGEFE